MHVGLVPPLLLEAPKRAVKLCVRPPCMRAPTTHVPSSSAANDVWGKTFKSLTGESKMTQNLAIATGCSAGATESFVVVPFELVKIKCVRVFPCLCRKPDVLSRLFNRCG